MKSFEEFKEYIKSNGNSIHADIVYAVNNAADKAQFESPVEEQEFLRRAWVEIGFMKMLEAYHNWLHS